MILFPSNHINPNKLNEQKKLFLDLLFEFETAVNKQGCSERNILNILREDSNYIIASLVKPYTDWGHHDLYVFKEFPLGSSFKVDFLLVGKNSHGYHFLFAELESVYGNISLQNGDFGRSIRNGLSQIQFWDNWLASNYSTLNQEFDKHLNKNNILPKEFRDYERSRISFSVISGRRTDFNENTYRQRRKLRNNNILVLHYDNIIDSAKEAFTAGKF